MKKDILYNLLSQIGYKKSFGVNCVIFTLDEKILVFPEGELSSKHFIATRHHLDYYGEMSSENFTRYFGMLF